MRYCKTCGIWVKNEVIACPLCQSVLQRETERPEEEHAKNTVVSGGYPPIEAVRKKYAFMLRICSCVGFLMMGILVAVNYVTYRVYSPVLWSVITDAAILYLLLTLRYSIFNGDEALATKVAVQCVAVMGLCVLIDFVLGFHGWSFDYALPSIVFVADAGIVLLMLIDGRNWQSYILLQLFVLLLSVVLLLLAIPGLVTHILLPVIAAGVTSLLFLGTWMIGGRRANTELKRRFHI